MSTGDYWFVPLGREKGGLLDLLGLPPDADEVTVGDAKADYQRKVNNGWKCQAKEEKKKVDAGKMSKEAFETRKAELKAEADELLMQLNALEAKYSTRLATLRKQKREGLVPMDPDPWRDAWKWAGVPIREVVMWIRALPRMKACELDLIAGSCTPPEVLESQPEEEARIFLDLLELPADVDEETVFLTKNIYERVVSGEFAKIVGSLERKLEAGTISEGEFLRRKEEHEAENVACRNELLQLDSRCHMWRHRRRERRFRAIKTLADLRRRDVEVQELLRESRINDTKIGDVAVLLAELLIERDVQLYSTSDRLWSEVRSTNRKCWIERIERWISESSTGPVGFVTRAVGAMREPLLPHVARPCSLEAGQMSIADAEDLRRGPKRPVEDPMEKILADLLAQKGREDRSRADPRRRVMGDEDSAMESAMRSLAAMKALVEAAEAAHRRRPEQGHSKRS